MIQKSKSNYRLTLKLFVFIALGGILADCSRSRKVTKTDFEMTTAEANYAEYCGGCHGQKMEMFVDRVWKHGSTSEQISKSIKYGIADAGMPAYDTTFTEQELQDLTAYIMTGVKARSSYDSDVVDTPKRFRTRLLNLEVDTVVSEIGIPWGVKVTRDGTIFYTEKKGTLNVQYPDGKRMIISGTPKVAQVGQGGMLDVALHPEFDQNKLLYLSYSKPLADGGSNTAVVRGRFENDKLVDVIEVFAAVPSVTTRYHFGSRMVFDNDGYLYVTVGDRGKRDDHPQQFDNSCGKVHRLNDDGSIPSDNPYVNQEGAIKSIWSHGHRNPQGMIYMADKDQLWAHEHGPRGGDELNRIIPHTNYGWPIISYGINYNGTTFTDKTEQEGMKQPIRYWIPSIAPSGMAYVNSDTYGAWKGDILSGSLRFNYISRIRLDGDTVVEEEKVLQDIGRVRSIEMGQDGFLYIGVEDPGRILRVKVVD